MARDVTPAAKTAAKAPIVRPIMLVHIALDTSPVYINSSDRTVIYGGNPYLGVGMLGKISGVKESSALQASGIRLSLSGIPPAYVRMVQEQHYQGREVTVYHGLLDANYLLTDAPILQWTGKIDQMSITLGDTATVVLTAENQLVRWEIPNVRRYTDADQQQRFPGDLGLQFMSQTVEKEILWGRVRARQ